MTPLIDASVITPSSLHSGTELLHLRVPEPLTTLIDALTFRIANAIALTIRNVNAPFSCIGISLCTGLHPGTWSRFSMSGTIVEEWNYDNKGRNLYEITYYDNGTVKEYRDFFSKTIQEYNVDGSIKGDKVPFN